MYLGDQQGVNIEIKDMKVRERNPEEEDDASAFYIQFNMNGPRNQMDDLVDLTEIVTYNAYTYKYVAAEGSNDPWVHTIPKPRDISMDENKLSFEYISENAGNFQLFFVIRGGGATPGYAFDAASEWTEVTFNMAGAMAGILGNHADAFDAGQPMRIDINGTGGKPIYLRAMRLHK